MVTILNNLGFIDKKPYICTFSGQYGVGKTNILIILTSELIKNGDNILFLSDDNVKYLAEKFAKLNVINRDGKLIIAKHFSNSSLKERIETLVNGCSFDYLIIDSVHNSSFDELNEAVTFLQEKQITTFISHQSKVNFTKSSNLLEQFSPILLNKSDYIISLTKKNTFTFVDWVKYSLLSVFFKRPNTTIKMLKNRYGKNLSKDFTVNFENLIIE